MQRRENNLTSFIAGYEESHLENKRWSGLFLSLFSFLFFTLKFGRVCASN